MRELHEKYIADGINIILNICASYAIK